MTMKANRKIIGICIVALLLLVNYTSITSSIAQESKEDTVDQPSRKKIDKIIPDNPQDDVPDKDTMENSSFFIPAGFGENDTFGGDTPADIKVEDDELQVHYPEFGVADDEPSKKEYKSPKKFTLKPNLSGQQFFINSTYIEADKQYDIKYTIMNSHSSTTKSFNVSFYLSNNSEINESNDFLLDNITIDGISWKSSLTQNITVTMPSADEIIWDKGQGWFFIGMIIDSNDAIDEWVETDNKNKGEGLDLSRLWNGTDAVDLYGTLFTIDRDACEAGDILEITMEILNNGNIACDKFNVSFYLSTDEIIHEGDDKLLKNCTIEKIGSCCSYVDDAVIVNTPLFDDWKKWLDKDDIDDFYYIGMDVDSNDEIDELDEQNNKNRGNGLDRQKKWACKQLPDLVGKTFEVFYNHSENWPSFHYNDNNSGFGYFHWGAEKVGSIKLFARCGETGYSSPVVAANGLVYICADKTIWCLNSFDLTEIWNKTIEGKIRGTAAIYKDRVIIGDTQGWIYCYSDTGEQCWKKQHSEASFDGACTVYNDSIYIGSTNNMLYRIDIESGDINWIVDLGHPIYSTPAIWNKTVIIGAGSKLYCFEAEPDDGVADKLWEYPLSSGEFNYQSPAVFNQSVFILSSEGKIYRINATTGDLQWEKCLSSDGEPSSDDSSTPAFYSVINWNLLCIGHENQFYTLKMNDGTIYNSIIIEDKQQFISSPVVSRFSNRVYFTSKSEDSESGRIYCYQATTLAPVWSWGTSANVLSSPAIAEDGTIFFGSQNGIYLIRDLPKQQPLLRNSPLIDVTFSIENKGSIFYDGFNGFNVSFYLSDNQEISSYDYELGTFHYNDEDMIPGEYTMTFNLPAYKHEYWKNKGGKDYFIGMIIDEDNEVSEGDNENNSNQGIGKDSSKITVRTTGYDLRIADFDVDSDNNNVLAFPDRCDYEEAIEDNFLHPKYVKWNRDNDDGNLGYDPDFYVYDEKDYDFIGGQALLHDCYQNQTLSEETGELVKACVEIGADLTLKETKRLVHFKLFFEKTGISYYSHFLGDGYAIFDDHPSMRFWRSPFKGIWGSHDEIINDQWYDFYIWRLGDLNNDTELTKTGGVEENDAALLQCAIDNEHPILGNSGTFAQWWNEQGFAQHHNYTDVCDMNGDGMIDDQDEDVFLYYIDNQLLEFVPLCFWIEGVHVNYDPLDSPPHVEVQLIVDFEDGEDTKRDSAFLQVDPIPTALLEGMFDYSVLPKGYDPNSPDFISDAYYYPNGEWAYPSVKGFQLGLKQGFGPGDYPPRTLDIQQSSTPLLTKESNYFRGPSPYAERPVHNEILDIITGQPLIQEIDFELPFGGAVFRHVRTYSETSGVIDYLSTVPSEYKYWDWNGQNWMNSENPIFLIDANWTNICYTQPKRCYFIPDAHHAIPFTWDENINNYTAPDWFDAILTYDSDPRGEEYPPVQWYVWLNHNTVKYTIKPYYEDAPSIGHYTKGIPYYGLVTKIEDRYGNTIENYYADFYQFNYDDPSTQTRVEKLQNWNEKGQLNGEKLRDAKGNVIWTILYVYRSFGNPNGWGTGHFKDPVKEELRHPHTLHAIYVYKGDREIPKKALTIPSNLFWEATSFEELNAIGSAESLGLDNDWNLSVQYLYDDGYDSSISSSIISAPSYQLYKNALWQAGEKIKHIPGHLLKTQVTRRSDDETVTDETNTIYRYEEVDAYDDLTDETGLEQVYYQDTISAVLQALQQEYPDETFTVDTFLNLPDDFLINTTDPETGKQQNSSFSDLADITFHTTPEFMISKNYFAKSENELHTYFIDTLIGGDPDKCYYKNFGKSQFIDRRDSSDSVYMIYQYVILPQTFDDYSSEDDYENCLGVNYDYHSLWHYPYAFGSYEPDGFQWVIPDGKNVTLVTILDKINTTTLKKYWWNAADETTGYYGGLESRQAFEMNAAGFVLRERSWSYENATGTLTKYNGTVENHEYDQFGRKNLTFSTGYNAVDNLNHQDERGLITFYNYTENYEISGKKRLGELHLVGIKNGNNGNVFLIQNFTYDLEDRPDLMTQQIQYPTPVALTTSEIPNDAQITQYEYKFNESKSGENPHEWPILEKKTTTSAIPDSSEDLFCSFEHIISDDCGNTIWRIYGDEDASGSSSQLYGDYYKYDENGRKILEVIDVDTSFYSFPDDYDVRIGPTPPLNSTTKYFYDDMFGLVKTIYPDGREQHIVYIQDKDDEGNILLIHRWTYSDLIWNDDESWTALSPVTIETYEEGQLQIQKTVRLTDTLHSGIPSGKEEYENISITIPTYDDLGRMVSVEQKDDEDTSVKSFVSYNGFGQVIREKTPAGSITRKIYDHLGRLEKTYLGTHDIHPFWKNVDPWDSVTDPLWVMNPDDHWPQKNWTDNMILSEKRYYSNGSLEDDTGWKNALKLLKIRRYKDKPQNQYFYINATTGEPDPPNNEDDIGWVEAYEYDWRMRPVITRYEDTQGQPIKHDVVWYDNLNRAVLRAVYDSNLDLPAEIDPRNLSSGWHLDVTQNISQLLNQNEYLLSLSLTKYNARGLEEEQRQYDVSSTDVGDYLSTINYYDYNNQIIETREPNAPVARQIYDAKHRLVSTSTFVIIDEKEVELTRMELFYDINDNQIKTINWERINGTDHLSTPLLNEDNSVKTFTMQWFNTAGKVNCTAEYGTNNPDGFITGEDPYPNCPDDYPFMPPPDGSFPDHVRITRYTYDKDGRQNGTRHPQGTWTKTEYDSLNRVILTTENAEDDLQLQRHTAYFYNTTTGQLMKMAAVLPNHVGLDDIVGISNWSDINWDAADDTIQVTELAYNATIINGTWRIDDYDQGWIINPLNMDNASKHHGWVSKVTYPDGDTLSFTYYSDGSVASRTDSKMNTFYYCYDELGQLSELYINDTSYYEDSPIPSPTRTQKIVYSYTPDGLQQRITTYAGGTLDSDMILSDNLYSYDGLRNLVSEAQSHGTLVDDGTPSVEYIWEFQPIGTGNFNRLQQMTYLLDERTITFNYDGEGGIDAALSRISSITDSEKGILSQYNYTGASRRIGMRYGNTIVTQSYLCESTSGYAGLDQFGQPTDLHFTDGAGSTLHRYQYGYDLAGNRVYARVEQADDEDGTSHINDRSYLYQYDNLSRLIQANMGHLNSACDEIIFDETPALLNRFTEWNLDIVGNWAGGTPEEGSMIRQDFAETGELIDRYQVHHQVDQANQIQVLTEKIDEDTSLDKTFVYDSAGNLVCDDEFFYQFDAFNRLIQINQKDSLLFDDNGKVTSGSIGTLVISCVYDGIGRLIQKIDAHDTVEDYYYDGVRRIQESVGGTHRDYIYGPEYVDEFIGFIHETTDDLYYYLQDANYNVMAIVNNVGQVVTQYQYDSYGTLAVVDTWPGAPINKVGHQGLFFDRFDDPDGRPLDTEVFGLYYNRNRWYNPLLGRFMSRDPHETAMPIFTACAMNGDIIQLIAHMYSIQGHYGDGMNLYEYLRSNPLSNSDPLGLMSLGDTYSLGALAAFLSAASFTQGMDKKLALMAAGGMAFDYVITQLVGAIMGGIGGRLLKRIAKTGVQKRMLTWIRRYIINCPASQRGKIKSNINKYVNRLYQYLCGGGLEKNRNTQFTIKRVLKDLILTVYNAKYSLKSRINSFITGFNPFTRPQMIQDSLDRLSLGALLWDTAGEGIRMHPKGRVATNILAPAIGFAQGQLEAWILRTDYDIGGLY